MENLKHIRKLYDLKIVYRDNPLQQRYESSAEHSRSAMLLAEYFMETMEIAIDKLKVLELLLYHDLAEIETGDISLSDTQARNGKKEREQQAVKDIASTLPSAMGEKYQTLYEEFEAKETLESRFANAIDKLDADFQCFSTPDNDLEKMREAFRPYPELLLRERKQKYFIEFPEINEAFEKILLSHKQQGFFPEI
jgi:putative hydrolase of HD superfamily